MSKKPAAGKSTKAPVRNLKPKARREGSVKGGLKSALTNSVASTVANLN